VSLIPTVGSKRWRKHEPGKRRAVLLWDYGGSERPTTWRVCCRRPPLLASRQSAARAILATIAGCPASACGGGAAPRLARWAESRATWGWRRSWVFPLFKRPTPMARNAATRPRQRGSRGKLKQRDTSGVTTRGWSHTRTPANVGRVGGRTGPTGAARVAQTLWRAIHLTVSRMPEAIETRGANPRRLSDETSACQRLGLPGSGWSSNRIGLEMPSSR